MGGGVQLLQALDKEYQSLAAFAKTEPLSPGASEELALAFDLARLASYREADASYVLEPGTYILRLGNSSRSTVPAGTLAEAVKKPVAHIDAFLVVLPLQVPVEVAVLLAEGNVGIPPDPGIGQLAGGGYQTGDHVGKGVPALASRLGEVQNGVDAGNVLEKAQVQGGAAVDDQQEFVVMGGAEARPSPSASA